MDRLSSCYFCGIALDEPLQDYPLVAADGEPSAVVTLCPTCRRKLETVLDAVVEEREVDLLELGGSDRPELTSGVDGALAGDDPEALTPGPEPGSDSADGEPADRAGRTPADNDTEPEPLGARGGKPEAAAEEGSTGREVPGGTPDDAADPDDPDDGATPDDLVGLGTDGDPPEDAVKPEVEELDGNEAEGTEEATTVEPAGEPTDPDGEAVDRGLLTEDGGRLDRPD